MDGEVQRGAGEVIVVIGSERATARAQHELAGGRRHFEQQRARRRVREVVGVVPVATKAEVAATVAAAKEAQAKWEARPLSSRVALLKQAVRALGADKDELARLVCHERPEPATSRLADLWAAATESGYYTFGSRW